MYSFIISVCIQTQAHFRQLERCIKSIYNFHKDSFIYLIDDSNKEYNDYIENYFYNYSTISIIKTKNNGSADQQVFKVILDIDDNSSHYIIIQDSMILNMKLENIESIQNIKFLWHFTNHIIHWDNIYEPKTEYNLNNNIVTHTDLIKHHLINKYSEDKTFLNYALDSLLNKQKWVGCFGNCCIITKNCLEYLNDKAYNFSDKFISNTSNRERRMNESIFALICHYYLPQDYSNSYDGLYYDGINVNKYSNCTTEFDKNLVYCCKNKYISKLSFNR